MCHLLSPLTLLNPRPFRKPGFKKNRVHFLIPIVCSIFWEVSLMKGRIWPMMAEVSTRRHAPGT